MRGRSLSFLTVILIFVAISAYLSLSGNPTVADTPPQTCKLVGEEWDYSANGNFPPFDCCSGLDACTDGYCCEVERNDNSITGQMIIRTPFEPPIGASDVIIVNNQESPVAYTCYQNSDCGTNTWTGNPYCKNEDVWQGWMAYTCKNPGTVDSYCSHSDQDVKKQECNMGCNEGECFSLSVVLYTCSQNSECGTDGWLDQKYCCPNAGEDTNICDTYRTYTCHNPGTPSAYCTNSDNDDIREDCGDTSHSQWSDPYCSGGDVWHSKSVTYRGCDVQGTERVCYSSSGTDEEKIEECGTNECSNGQCVEDYTCSQNSDCGTDGYTGDPYCQSGDVYQDYRTHTCHNPATTSSYCTHSDNGQKKQDCGSYGCTNGQCNSPTHTECENQKCVTKQGSGTNECTRDNDCTVECSSNSDCGTNEWRGDAYCQDTHVYQTYRTYTCNNPGQTSSSCSHDDESKKKQDCGNSGCSNGQCNSPTHTECQNQQCVTVQGSGTNQCTMDNDCTIACSSNSDCGTNGYTGNAYCKNGHVYQEYITYTCSNPGQTSSSCSHTNNEQKKQDCGSSGCSNGQCNSGTITCSQNSDCGTDGYTGDPYCQSGDVYQNYKTYECKNPGETNSYCEDSDSGQIKEDCGSNTCTNGQCDTGNGDLADLKVTDLRVMWPPNPEVGDIVTFDFVIKNTGSKKADNINFKLLPGDSNWNAPQPINLDPGEDIQIFHEHIYNNPGTYTVEAIADPDNSIQESDENNNQKSIIITVT
jgi:hypothetical protein